MSTLIQRLYFPSVSSLHIAGILHFKTSLIRYSTESLYSLRLISSKLTCLVLLSLKQKVQSGLLLVLDYLQGLIESSLDAPLSSLLEW